MTNPTPLSPSAQAVLDALHTENSTGPERYWARANAAAAIRAAADQVVPEFWHEDSDIYGETMQDVREKFLAIADELEAR